MFLRCTATWHTVLEAVLLPIIIGEFVSWLDVLERHNEDATLVNCCLCVRTARVIDIPRFVYCWLPVYGLCLRYLKKVLALAALGFLRGEHSSNVFDDAASFRYYFARK